MKVNKNLPIVLSIFLIGSTLVADSEYKEESLKNGQEIYETTCASCHGKNGETNPDMYLIVKPRKLNQTILTQEQSFKIIKEGAHYFGAHSDIMPAFKYVYDDEELQNVALYITETFNLDRDKKVLKLLEESDVISKKDKVNMLKIGEKIFKKNCSMCHGKTGDGKSAYVEQSRGSNSFMFPYNLTRTLLDENQIFLYSKFGGHYWGTDKKDMPAWSGKYNDFKLKSVAKYINEKIKKIK